MSCDRWRELLPFESVDDMGQARRRDFLSHLRACSSCRRMATETDPTLAFSLLQPERVEEGEVEEIRHTVQAMRRVRALEASWSQRARQGLAAGAFAALVLIGVLLVPQRPEPQSPAGVPFAGAVGVGAGLVEVPRAPTHDTPVVLQAELARSARLAHLTDSPTLHRIARAEMTVQPGDQVDRDLGHGYRVRFFLASAVPTAGAILEDFQLLQPAARGEVPLLEADLQPLPNSPLVVGVTPAGESVDQLWLLLTYSVDNPRAP